jgi:hypothetical protein
LIRTKKKKKKNGDSFILYNAYKREEEKKINCSHCFINTGGGKTSFFRK